MKFFTSVLKNLFVNCCYFVGWEYKKDWVCYYCFPRCNHIQEHHPFTTIYFITMGSCYKANLFNLFKSMTFLLRNMFCVSVLNYNKYKLKIWCFNCRPQVVLEVLIGNVVTQTWLLFMLCMRMMSRKEELLHLGKERLRCMLQMPICSCLLVLLR